MKDMEKTYSPAGIEDRQYARWESSGYFKADAKSSKKPFTIVMPPPNITGQLHMGHALDNTLPDILIRMKRMQGFETLWLPGTDHASIATEAKVVESMREEGVTKEMLGREGFLERAWAWREKYGKKIVQQLRKLGCSCDWDRERFTMDEGCSHAVKTVFVKLYDEGLIYRGNRMVNWCPNCRTSISDAEVEHEEQDGHFWHLLYPVKETGEMLELATTRPETMLGDTAVAINPEDPRFLHLHGCHVILPLLNKEIPIVLDEHADMEKGTGVVKITPAHDPNDFEVGNRHDLPRVRVLTYDGRMTGAADAAEAAELLASGRAAQGEPEVLDCGKYAGMTVKEARKAIVADLEAGGYLKKIEPLKHEVGTCYRCHSTIEPMVSKQWFVKMVPLAEPAIKTVEDGNIRFVPERFTKLYLNWMNNTRDWCISRQLWWGHQIPAWYCDDCGETVVAAEAPAVCPKCGGTHLTQDPDTLDTWFSSALWPFSTLGWPDDTEDLRRFYPTDVMVTGYDIIGFWVSRMIFSGLAYTGKDPFHTVLIHGIVRDDKGRKMSKSLGNGIDPLEVIEKYGADALRMMLVTGNSPGNDMRFYWERVEASRNFINKVWNASRFMLMNIDGMERKPVSDVTLLDEDKWILSRLNEVIREVTDNIERYELGIALQKIYDFVWEEFCDWYIEMVKPRFYGESDAASKEAAAATLYHVLRNALKLLHPFIPFVTEEIYGYLETGEETIMRSDWPVPDPALDFPEEEQRIAWAKDIVKAVRQIRVDMQVAPSKKVHLSLVSEDAKVRGSLEKSGGFIRSLANASGLAVQADKAGIPSDAISAVTPAATLFIPMDELVDKAKEIDRLTGELKRLTGELARSRSMLGNERFLSKAPQAKIDEEKAKLEKYEKMFREVEERLAQLKG
ncbi:MAG: valine--tRNA ligase [Lachnospiraceae bacterium]|nr:valine--tRNA ligase [Lachnospiraceae bacterium]